MICLWTVVAAKLAATSSPGVSREKNTPAITFVVTRVAGDIWLFGYLAIWLFSCHPVQHVTDCIKYFNHHFSPDARGHANDLIHPETTDELYRDNQT